MVRKSQQNFTFAGTFEESCEEQSIPASLLATVKVLLYGSSVTSNCQTIKPALTICQLILLNHHKKTPKANVFRHNKSLEPPLPLYIIMSIAAFGRRRDKT